jgi:predicted ATP-dependent endonuclease of OLD family
MAGVINNFFQSINSLFAQMKTDKKGAGVNLDWLLNKAQIDRIMSIIEIVDTHKAAMDEFMSPVNQFLATINGFYADSSKKIDIDPVGCLVVTRKDGKTTSVEALSSGERQILVILAHLMFNRYFRKSGVVIIDEPELSLHLKWQGMFVEEVTRLSPDTQFIMATHSPEIVGDFSAKCRPVVEAQP